MKRKRMPKRYAQGTKVAVAVSRTEVEALLTKHEAHATMTGCDNQKQRAFVQFSMAKRIFRIPVDYSERVGRAQDLEQRQREAWRLLFLIIKSKLEVIRMGESSPEVEFLANVMLPDGSTVQDQVLPELERVYLTGQMPKLLGAG